MIFLLLALLLLIAGLAYSVYHRGLYEIWPSNNFKAAENLFELIVVVIALIFYLIYTHSGDPIKDFFGI